jgi:hypothetical protein
MINSLLCSNSTGWEYLSVDNGDSKSKFLAGETTSSIKDPLNGRNKIDKSYNTIKQLNMKKNDEPTQSSLKKMSNMLAIYRKFVTNIAVSSITSKIYSFISH